MDRREFEELMKYQNSLQKNLRKESRIDKKLELLTVINQLTSGPGNIVQKEQVQFAARERGFTSIEVDRYLDELIDDDILFMPSPGYIKKKR